MRYISTRGEAPALGFEDVLLTGLATDGGLYVPESLPHFDLEEIRSWRGLSYSELAFNVMYPFVDDAIPADDFRKMLDHVAENAPMRRNVTVDEVGNVAAFLCSDLASGISAEITYVDSGYNTVGMTGYSAPE